MRTSGIGAIQTVERRIKNKSVVIGTIEMTDINEWWWVCYVADKEEDTYEVYFEGCAVSRADSIYYVRKEYREQLTELINHNQRELK